MRNATYDHFVETTKAGLRSLVSNLAPDADPLPMLNILGEIGDAMCGMPMFENEEQKNLIADRVIPGLLQQAKANFGAFHCTAWLIVHTPETAGMAGLIPPSMDPDRKECLMLTTFCHDREEMHSAPIVRHEGKAPSLGSWTTFPGGDGRFTGFSKFCSPVDPERPTAPPPTGFSAN